MSESTPGVLGKCEVCTLQLPHDDLRDQVFHTLVEHGVSWECGTAVMESVDAVIAVVRATLGRVE